MEYELPIYEADQLASPDTELPRYQVLDPRTLLPIRRGRKLGARSGVDFFDDPLKRFPADATRAKFNAWKVENPDQPTPYTTLAKQFGVSRQRIWQLDHLSK